MNLHEHEIMIGMALNLNLVSFCYKLREINKLTVRVKALIHSCMSRPNLNTKPVHPKSLQNNKYKHKTTNNRIGYKSHCEEDVSIFLHCVQVTSNY